MGWGAASATAKTLVYCSEGSPENFYPAINTTGTSFDASSRPIYNRLLEFERADEAALLGERREDEDDDGARDDHGYELTPRHNSS